MDIKDSYLHGTVGVVKSISVNEDKLIYNLADVGNTAKTVTLPLATTSANGLLSSTDKAKLDASTGVSQAIPYIVGPDTDTTAGTWTGSYSGITAYTDGLTIIYVPKIAGNSTTTLNINGLGAKTCYYTGTSKLTTHYAVGTPILFTYSGGAWKRADYVDGNTYTSAWCVTDASTAAKTATCSNYNLKEKSYIHILIRHTNTVAGNITLNINNTGAKPIYINGKASSSSNYTLPAGTYIVYYDGANFYFRTDGTLPGIIENSYGAKYISLYVDTITSSLTSKNKYYKFATINLTDTNWSECSINFLFASIENTLPNGLLTLSVRRGNSITSLMGALNWLSLDDEVYKDSVVLCNTDTDGVYDLYFQPKKDYCTVRITAITSRYEKLQMFRGGYFEEVTPRITSKLSGYVYHAERITCTEAASNKDYPIILTSNTSSGIYESLLYNPNITLNPSTGNLKATNFIGNLDGIYVNKLTGYTKATSASNIAITDSLNTALGKLEYRVSTSESALNSCLKWDENSYYNINPISKQENGVIRLSFRGTFGEETKQVIGIGYSNDEIWFGNYLTNSFIRISDKITFNGKTLALLNDLVSDNITIKNYTKAATIGAIGNNDSLTTALGKLEYKADLAYNWVTNVTATDTDEYINKWSEIVGFLDSVKEGTDILTELVTVKTELEIVGKKTFINSQGTIFKYGNYGARLIGSGGYGYLQLGQIDGEGTKIHEGRITGINAAALGFLGIVSKATVFDGTVTATKLITKNGTSSQFVKGDGSLDSNQYFTYIKSCTSDTNADDLDYSGLYFNSTGNGSNNSNFPTTYGYLVNFVAKINNFKGFLIHSSSESMQYRRHWNYGSADTDKWTDWKILLDSTNYVNYPVKNPYSLKLTDTAGNVVSYDGSAEVDLRNGVHSAVHLKNKVTIKTKDSDGKFRYVSDVKKDLIETFGTITSGIGSSVVFPEETLVHWNKDNEDNNYLFTHSGLYTAIKISGGYSGSNYGQWLCSAYGDKRLYYIGLNNGDWTTPRLIAIKDDIPTHTNQLINNSGFLTSRGYIGTTAVQESSTALELKGITNLTMAGDILISSGNTNKYITFKSSDNLNNWRIGYLGSGASDANYLTFESNQSTGTYVKALQISNIKLTSTFGGDVLPATNDAKNLGSSTLKWSNVYATTFTGNLTGDVTGNVSGSSGSCMGNAATATTLKPTTVVSAKTFSLSNASWTDTDYTFESLATGTYAVQITSGSNLVASGIMSVYKNLSDTAGDEIPLHVYGTASWRPYLRTHQNKLEISSNDASAKNRTVTIKIAQIL